MSGRRRRRCRIAYANGTVTERRAVRAVRTRAQSGRLSSPPGMVARLKVVRLNTEVEVRGGLP